MKTTTTDFSFIVYLYLFILIINTMIVMSVNYLQRWFLYPPEKTPSFHPNRTTLQWFTEDFPKLHPQDYPLDCTISQGEVSMSSSKSNYNVLTIVSMTIRRAGYFNNVFFSFVRLFIFQTDGGMVL